MSGVPCVLANWRSVLWSMVVLCGARGSVAFRDQKIFELPRVSAVELWLVISAERVDVVLQWGPIRSYGNELAQVGFADIQHIVMRQIVRHGETAAWIFDHPHASGNHRNGNLHGRSVLVRDQAARLLDIEIGSAPPRL